MNRADRDDGTPGTAAGRTGLPAGAAMVGNLGWGFLHHGIGRAAMFAFFVLLPLLIPIEDVGRFTLVYAALLIVLRPVVEFSFGLIVTKYAARGRADTVRTAFRAVGRGLPALLVAAFLVAVVTPIPTLLTGLLLAEVGLTLGQELVFAYFRGRQRMRLEGIVGSTRYWVALGALLGLWAAGLRGPELPAAALLLMAISGWLLMAVLFRSALGVLRDDLRENANTVQPWWPVMREGLVLGAVGFVGFLYLRTDVLMLGAMVGPGEVGLYFTASKWIEATFVVPSVLMLVFMPHLVKAGDPSVPLRRMAWLLGGLGLLATAAAAVVGWWPVPAVYGDDGTRIQLLMWALAPAIAAVYLGFLLTQTLVVLDLHGRYLRIALAGLAVNVACNVLLIPVLHGVGAGIATVATEVLVTVAAAVTVRRRLAAVG